jgi:hypothetical protein
MESRKYEEETVWGAISKFYSAKQDASTSNAKYLSIFKSSIDAIEHFGASVGDHPVLIQKELKLAGNADTNDAGEIEEAQVAARNKFYAYAFIKNADTSRYGPLMDELSNQHTLGSDQFPADVTAAYNLLLNYKNTTT